MSQGNSVTIPIDPRPPASPLSPAELDAWTAALRGSFTEIVRFLQAHVDDAPRVEASLLQVLDAREDVAAGIGKAVLALPAESRVRVLSRAAADPRPAVRRALFEEWAPPRLEVPRGGTALLPEPDWTSLLRRALADEERAVRASATALAFDTSAGGGLVPELLANLDASDTTLRWCTVLALGAARDAGSLVALRAAARGEDAPLASAAVRALAARPDGHDEWQRALSDPRAEVQAAAIFALARVVEGLDAAVLEALDDPAGPPELRAAVRAYRARME